MAEAKRLDAVAEQAERVDRPKLSWVQSINYQQGDIERWSKVLTPEAVRQLKLHAESSNEIILATPTSTPYDIFRGQMIYEWLSNNLMRK